MKKAVSNYTIKLLLSMYKHGFMYPSYLTWYTPVVVRQLRQQNLIDWKIKEYTSYQIVRPYLAYLTQDGMNMVQKHILVWLRTVPIYYLASIILPNDLIFVQQAMQIYSKFGVICYDLSPGLCFVNKVTKQIITLRKHNRDYRLPMYSYKQDLKL